MDPQQQFCPNFDCSARGKTGEGNIVVHSRKEKRYKCTMCGRTFVGTTGTPFYRLRSGLELVTVVITLIAHGCPVQAIVAAFRLDERTVASWEKRAGQHSQAVHEALVHTRRDLQHVQADELRVKVQGGVVWMAAAIMVSTRLWLGGVVGAPRDSHLVAGLFTQVRACALCRPLLICVDGFVAYVKTIRKAFRSPLPTTQRGRPHLVAWPGIVIAQVVKRYERRRVAEVIRRMAQGTLEQATVLLARSNGGRLLNMAYIERLNATFRSRLAPLARRTRSLLRQTERLNLAMYLVGCVYNLCTDHESLRVPGILGGKRKWLPRTPAMAANITDHRWTVQELLSYRIPPPLWIPPKRRGRPPKAVAQARAAWA